MYARFDYSPVNMMVVLVPGTSVPLFNQQSIPGMPVLPFNQQPIPGMPAPPFSQPAILHTSRKAPPIHCEKQLQWTVMKRSLKYVATWALRSKLSSVVQPLHLPPLAISEKEVFIVFSLTRSLLITSHIY